MTAERVRPELLAASDETIEDAVAYADPMALRGLLYQLTGDDDVAGMQVGPKQGLFREVIGVVNEADIASLRRKTAEFLKSYRDAGAGEISIGPAERLPASLALAAGDPLAHADIGLWLEELALDPWARGLEWQAPPRERLEGFHVIVIGAGMGGLNAALQLKHAGIPYTVIEKNSDVGGTWFENRYPGARVDSPSRSYTHSFGVDFPYPNSFCLREENQRYFRWVAETFDLRGDIVFNTEVRSLTWDEACSEWQVAIDGPEGARTVRANAVITAVGFLNRPNIPEIEGMADFRGPSWHTARWPDDFEVNGKRIAVIGTGASGYQLIPELALEAEHVTVFQRTPQWLIPTPEYRSPFPPQVNWLDRNLPFHTNFMRFRATTGIRGFTSVSEIDPSYHDDPNACSEANKRMRETCVAFLERKLADPELVAKMTPPHPVLSARPLTVDSNYCVLDAIQRDNVTLVTAGIRRINETGVEADDGTRHDVDLIVYATGFRANDYLFPMTITGRNGKTIEDLWSDGGARAYMGSMMPGFPNLWAIYGPNTNGGLSVATFEEMVVFYALQCLQRVILDDKREIETKEDAYWRYNELVDERNRRKVWSDPRARNYWWNAEHDRSATMCPFQPGEMWHKLRSPNFDDHDLR